MSDIPPLIKSESSHWRAERKQRAKSYKHDTLLKWKTEPTHCLVIKKINDRKCTQDFMEVVQYLLEEKEIKVFIQESTFIELKKLSEANDNEGIKAQKILEYKDENKLQTQNEKEMGKDIHLMIVLGGDGTLLYLVSLFQNHQHVPPIVCFQRGSLGFLAPFQMKDYKTTLNEILDTSASSKIAIRMRLTARIWRHPDNMNKEEYKHIKSPRTRTWSKEIKDMELKEINKGKSPSISSQSGLHGLAEQSSFSKSQGNLIRMTSMEDQKQCSGVDGDEDNFLIKQNRDISFTKTSTKFPGHVCNTDICHALNEVLVHRDNNASMMQGQLHIDGDYCTTIQADGMIFSTPTGSTAYNISAGGSLISPTVPCIALTPICPHTLSFRPVVVSDDTIIHVQIPKTARFNAIISFDGRNHITLNKGDVVEIIKCPYPVPTFKSERLNVEWFQGLVSKFNWNLRELQKPFEAAEEQEDDDEVSKNGKH